MVSTLVHDLLGISTIKRRGRSPARKIGFPEGELPELSNNLLGRIRAVLLERERSSGLNRSDFLKEIGVPRRTYYEILEGTANMRLSSLDLLAHGLDMSLYELLGVPVDALEKWPSDVRKVFPDKE